MSPKKSVKPHTTPGMSRPQNQTSRLNRPSVRTPVTAFVPGRWLAPKVKVSPVCCTPHLASAAASMAGALYSSSSGAPGAGAGAVSPVT